MIKEGDEVNLTSKTKRGKDRISRDGSKGIVKRVTKSVLFNPGIAGPWLAVESPNGLMRWVHQDNDPDFKVEVI